MMWGFQLGLISLIVLMFGTLAYILQPKIMGRGLRPVEIIDYAIDYYVGGRQGVLQMHYGDGKVQFAPYGGRDDYEISIMCDLSDDDPKYDHLLTEAIHQLEERNLPWRYGVSNHVLIIFERPRS